MNRNDLIVFAIIVLLIAFARYARACETKTVYLPDGSIQVCQVCEDVVVCY